MAAEPPSSSPGDLTTPPPKSPSPGGAIVLNSKPSNGVASGAVAYPDLSATASPANGSAGGSKPDEPAEKAPRKRRARASTADPKDGDDGAKPAKVPRKARAPRKPKAEEEPAPAQQAPASRTAPTSQPPAAAPLTASHSANMQPSRPSSRQQKITDLVNQDPASSYGGYSSTGSPQAHQAAYYGGSADSQRPQSKPDQHAPPAVSNNPANSSPRSGQRYDPIRSSTADHPRPYPTSSTPHQTSPIKATYRASASPSISSLIDPAPASLNSPYSYNPPAKPSPVAAHAVPQASTNLLSTQPPSSQNARSSTPQNAAQPKQQLEVADAMDVDTASGKAASRKTSVSNTNPPSKAASPKPPKKEKEKVGTTPPLPMLPGSGAIASTLFGPGQAPPSDSASGPSIILHIPLNGATNKYVNFARLAEEKYGFSALHPRLAAQKDRLARVAAAGAALENSGKGSGDEMSLDISDGENDLSNVETGGDAAAPDKAADAADGKKPRKKRRMKEDMYDKEDPFVDDTELAWEEQAAASKDGFFVYSGPLVPEGETARVERADGTIIKPPTSRGRGRGRGGGPGSRGGTSRTAGGPGSRGGQGAARRTRGARKGAAAAAGEGKKAGDADAASTPGPKSKTEPVNSSPLGQQVQVQVPLPAPGLHLNGVVAKHEPGAPTATAA